ncbi:coiled-coil domain-containing protein 167 [Solenopsis invicta]|uniref:coiled-coil domain-containing protein 167 n=1 Tax=Solenopsis invicta TaxID=13686 RepID=UPI000595B1AA|nr:coiled-coil domain-containing protein 167 [Solenopsis invicta]
MQLYTMTRNDTIITKMEHVEASLRDTLYKVDVIERKLKTKILTAENREKLENELEEVKKVLRQNEKELQSLRKENSKSFVLTACLVFVCFLIYGIYSLIFGNV